MIVKGTSGTFPAMNDNKWHFDYAIDFKQWMLGWNYWHPKQSIVRNIGFGVYSRAVEKKTTGSKMFNVFILCIRIGLVKRYEYSVPL